MNEYLLFVPASIGLAVIVYWMTGLTKGTEQPKVVEKPAVPEVSDKMTKAQLLEVAGKLGLDVKKSATKAVLLKAIKNA